MSQTIKDQIIEQFDCLDDPRRRQVLDFARRLTGPAGTPGRNLLHFAGTIDPAGLEAMAPAIDEGCERVDPNAWQGPSGHQRHHRSFRQGKNLLRSKGVSIPEKDIWIAAVARQYGLPLATRDEHFKAVDGLTLGESPCVS